ncbi:MAG: AtpZ/AtpI family protein [Holosporales bacterium]|jgi:F0F1-type ATP synthase assembly protein I|nr:AtpZ/AtpI family protein [Holosporales bacterium]
MENKPAEHTFEVRLRNLEDRIKIPATRSSKSSLTRSENPIIRVGAEFFSGVAVSMLFGVAIDRYWNTHPYGLLIAFSLGICTGFFNVFRVLKRKEERARSQ